MTSTDITPFSLPGTRDYAEATTTFQLAAQVDPTGAFTARSVDEVVRAVATARRTNLPLRLNTTGHAMGRTSKVRSLTCCSRLAATPRPPAGSSSGRCGR
jgi:hypothetical protein